VSICGLPRAPLWPVHTALQFLIVETDIRKAQGGLEMLVLSRKTGQRAIIAGNIRVVVLSVHGNRVKLGFEGPTGVPIHREEVYQRIARETHALALAGEDEPQ
jgi:carbon storage regulator